MVIIFGDWHKRKIITGQIMFLKIEHNFENSSRQETCIILSSGMFIRNLLSKFHLSAVFLFLLTCNQIVNWFFCKGLSEPLIFCKAMKHLNRIMKKSNKRKYGIFSIVLYSFGKCFKGFPRYPPKNGDKSRFTRDKNYRKCSYRKSVWWKRNRHQDTRNFSHHPSSKYKTLCLRIFPQFHLRWTVWNHFICVICTVCMQSFGSPRLFRYFVYVNDQGRSVLGCRSGSHCSKNNLLFSRFDCLFGIVSLLLFITSCFFFGFVFAAFLSVRGSGERGYCVFCIISIIVLLIFRSIQTYVCSIYIKRFKIKTTYPLNNLEFQIGTSIYQTYVNLLRSDTLDHSIWVM